MRFTLVLQLMFACCLVLSLPIALRAQQPKQRFKKLSAIALLDVYEARFEDSLIYFQGKKYLVLLKEDFEDGQLSKVSVYHGMDYVGWTDPEILKSEEFQKAYDLSYTLNLRFKGEKKLRLNDHTYLIKAKENERLYLRRKGKRNRLKFLT